MNLNTIQMMNQEELRNTVDQSGYVEIAQMLWKLNLNGSDFLATTEFQTINWKITPFQRKQLCSFLKQLKKNPSILRISSPSVPGNPKAQLFTSQKPIVPKKTVQSPPSQFPGKKDTKSLDDVFEEGTVKAYKLQLEKVLGKTNNTANKPMKIHYSAEEITHRNKKSDIKRKTKLLPLPDGDEHDEENEYIDMNRKLHQGTNDDHLLSSDNVPEDTYENLSTNTTVSKNVRTLPSGRINNIAPPRIIPTHKSNDERFKLPPRELKEDTYEPPPLVKPTKKVATPILSREKSQPFATSVPISVQVPEEDEDTYEVPNEPPRGRWEPPVPPLLFRANSPVVQRSKSPIPVRDDDEDVYEPPPNHLKYSASPSVANRKPIPTPTRDDLRLRTGQMNLSPNAFQVPLHQSDKSPTRAPLSDQRKGRNSSFDGHSNKATGNDGRKKNYENHTMKGVNRNNIHINPISNRPLPPIPTAETNNPRGGAVKSPEYVKLTKNHQVDYGKSETDDDDDEDNKVYQNLPHASKVPSGIDEELPEYFNCPNPPPSVVIPQCNSVEGHNNNQQESIKLGQKETNRDNLALQLASELSARNKNKMMWSHQTVDLDEQPEYSNNNNSSRQNTIRYGYRSENNSPPLSSVKVRSRNELVKSPVAVLPKPPAFLSNIPTPRESIIDDYEDSDEFDDDDECNIFNISNVPYYRDIDRRGAKLLLRGYEEGAFLFRPSQNYFLVLTVKCKSKCYNLGIDRTENDKITLNADAGSTAPEFSSLQDFVNYFTDEPVTFQDGGELIETRLKSVLLPDHQ